VTELIPPNSRADRNPRVLVSIFAYNEGDRFRDVLRRFPARRAYDVLVVDDGSSDGTCQGVEESDFKVIRNPHNEGLGASIKKAFRYALEHQYDAIVIMAGNGKDDPNEIELLLQPVLRGGYDFAQGARFLDGGAYGNMPYHRLIATRYIHPLIFSLLSGRRVTESTNGFRAFRTSILRDDRINWRQTWLNQYELEQYLHFKVVRLGYKRIEVPVTKIYPSRSRGYTKVKAFTGWWSMIRPLIYLAAGVKR